MSPSLSMTSGILLIAAGLAMAIASFFAMGEADSWDRAALMAQEALEPGRRTAMLVSFLGMALAVPCTAAVVGQLQETPGFGLAALSYGVYAVGACLFMAIIGVVVIAMPALGELAAQGSVDVQAIADAFTRQSPIFVAFLGANATYLAWVGLFVALGRSGLAPPMVPWVGGALVLAGWARFLHVPGFQQLAGWAWAGAVGLMGAWLCWVARS